MTNLISTWLQPGDQAMQANRETVFNGFSHDAIPNRIS
jgi:hypothetical protein